MQRAHVTQYSAIRFFVFFAHKLIRWTPKPWQEAPLPKDPRLLRDVGITPRKTRLKDLDLPSQTYVHPRL